MAIAFYILALLSILGGVLMVTRKNPLSSAFSLILSLVALAGLFAMLLAEFIFILQILVYAGAIMVLVIFTIMLLNLKREEIRETPVGKFQVVFLIILCAAGAFGFIEIFSDIPAAEVATAEDFGSIEQVGRLMLGSYLFPFEVISVLLLVAIVGVVLLAKRVI
jgi:NADH-quinone oxidoreductase subunit J